MSKRTERTTITIVPAALGWDYKIELLGKNYGGGWAANTETLANIIGCILRFDLPREEKKL